MKALIDYETKICKICKIEKPLIDFHKNKSCKLGVVGTCRVCSGQRIVTWYKDNRDKRRIVANTRNKVRKAQMVEYFGGICFDCKLSYPQCVFQFHHLDPTKKDVNPSYAMTCGEDRMWKELKKCVMLCANCHIIRHRLSGEIEN